MLSPSLSLKSSPQALLRSGYRRLAPNWKRCRGASDCWYTSTDLASNELRINSVCTVTTLWSFLCSVHAAHIKVLCEPTSHPLPTQAHLTDHDIGVPRPVIRSSFNHLLYWTGTHFLRYVDRTVTRLLEISTMHNRPCIG